MTRFARASGSKASNERLPEQATSWTTMKKDLEQSKTDAELEKQREKINEIRQRKYDNFVEEAESKIEKKWVEFPETQQSPMKRISKSPAKLLKEDGVLTEKIDKLIQTDAKMKRKSKNLAKLVKEDVVSTEKIDELIQTDAKIDTGILYLESLMNKKKKFKKANDDDAPTEESDSKLKKKSVEFSGNKKHQSSKKRKKSNSPVKLVNEQPDAKIDREVDYFESPMNKKKKLKKANDDDAPEVMSAKIRPKLNVKNENKKQNQEEILKNAKVTKKEHKRRKEIKPKVLIVDGVEETLVYFQGFPIRKADADHLMDLRKTMCKKGISLGEIERTLKRLSRKSQRATSRLCKTTCYQCRKPGHLLSDCPEVGNSASPIETVGSGICYKCGSTEHSHLKCRTKEGYKFATCFICREQGHIARECPDNSRGLYPSGGSCKLCGDVTHFKKDCPTTKQEKFSNELVVGTIAQTSDIESLDNAPKTPKIQREEQKVVVF